MRGWGVALVLAALVAAGWWVFRPGAEGPRAPRARDAAATAGDGRRGPAENAPPGEAEDGEARAVGPTEAPPTVTVTGTVVDDRNAPIPGATVRWTSDPTRNPIAEARADDSGAFRLERTEDGTASYLVSAPGFTTRVYFDLPDALRFELKRGSLRIRARVMDPEDRPVAGARGWALLGVALGTATSDEDGYLEFRDMATYDAATLRGVVVRAEGFAEQFVSFRLPDSDLLDLGDIVLWRGSTVRGVVRDKDTRQPVAGVDVTYVEFGEPAWEKATRTEDDGSFELEPVPPRADGLLAAGRGYLPDRTGWDPHALRPPLVPAGESTFECDVLVVRAVTVRGRVRNESGAAVADAEVEVTEQHHEQTPRIGLPDLDTTATTDADGRFEIEGYYPGMLLDVKAEHEEEGAVETEARAGEEIELRLVRTCRLSGRVVAADGRKVVNAAVYLRPLDDPSGDEQVYGLTDDEGEFAFAHVPPGDWLILVNEEGHKPLGREITVGRGERVRRVPDLVLPDGGVIAGMVVDANGAPLAEVLVFATGDEERLESGRSSGSAETGADGRFRIAGLHDGSFRVGARADGHYFDDVEVASGGPPVRIEMRRTITVRGRVSAGGQPLPGVGVAVNRHYSGRRTAADGSFTVKGLRPDRPFRLELSHPMFKTLDLRELEPWEGVREFELVAGRAFQGVVVDEAGKPLAGINVFVRTKERKDGRSAETDPAGRFSVAGLEEGPTVVRASGVGYAFELPVEVPEGVGSCRLVLREGYEMKMLVRRKDGKPPEDVSLTVIRPDGTEVEAGFSWEIGVGRASTTELARGKYRIVVSGYARGPGGTMAEHYGEVTLEFENPGPEKTVVLPK